MSAGMTYADVRDFVLGQVGDDCVSTEGLELFMRNCLFDMFNKLGAEEEHGEVTITVSPSSPTFKLPDGVDKLLGLVDDKNCPLPSGKAPCLMCAAGKDHARTPTSWEVVGGSVVFHPAPDKVYTYRAETLKSLDCTLYVADGQGVRTWKEVALPEALHTVYAKCVLGMSLIDSDPAAAQNWLSISDGEFNTWKGRLSKATSTGLSWGRTAASAGSYGTPSHSLDTILKG